jgi:hypothetical protein
MFIGMVSGMCIQRMHRIGLHIIRCLILDTTSSGLWEHWGALWMQDSSSHRMNTMVDA